MSDDEKKKPELSYLGNLTDMTEDELIESIMQFIESKVSTNKDDE